ncbi:UNVERIFIED_CONTAM: hypothetical protein RMT77_007737 [Armadillidium vulgare]
MEVTPHLSEIGIIENIDENQPLWQIDDDGNDEERAKIEEEAKLALEREKSSVVIGTPTYKSDFTGFLMEKEFSIETGKHIKNDSTPRRTCFNCLGDHNISECKERKNPGNIARNRIKILGKRNSNVRYHEDGENKYGHFMPGKVSKHLREALRLKDFEAPDFIYRMRILGYPPGWLKEAEVKRSSVLLIDGGGKEVSHPDDEEGETDVCLIKYQPEKFISYPGFNVPFPEHIEDECRRLNYPPMQNFHAKENFLKYMKLNKADLTRKKLIEQKNSSFISNPHLGDMEIEDGETDDLVIEVSKAVEVSCVEEEQKKSKEEGELSEDSNECSNAEKSSLPPSDNSSLSKVDKTLEKSLDSESISKSEEEITLKRKIDSEVSDDSSSSSSITVKRQHKSSSKGFTLGVCIPESVTPFQKLPESTKWSVDVSDHILFDNLPDSTGTWQKMKDIVKGVQNEMQKLNSVKNS